MDAIFIGSFGKLSQIPMPLLPVPPPPPTSQVYEATLAAPLLDKEAEAAAKRFASGGLQLQGDYDPLLPAKLLMLSDTRARVSICEGRYHQVSQEGGRRGRSLGCLQGAIVAHPS